MISKQNVYLNSDRTRAVTEDDKEAKFLLVREGHEIENAEAEKYDGAVDLIGAEAKRKAASPSPAAAAAPAKPTKPTKPARRNRSAK